MSVGSASVSKMGSFMKIASRERIEEEDDVPFSSYLCNDSESSCSSSDGEEAAGTMALGGLEDNA
jgi:Dullard-like phosphatase family protein